MQFSSIIAALSFALVASAAPNPTNPAPVNSCSQNQVESCCNIKQAGILPIGIDCVAVNILAIAGSQCSGNKQQLSCCSANQNGAINVGSVCPNLAVL